jgi:hypothetical protein
VLRTEIKASGEIFTHVEGSPDFVQDVMRHGIVKAGAKVMAALNPGAVTHPLGPPVVSGTTYTVDFALQNVTQVVTPLIMDLTLQRFFVDRVFANAGGVTGGAVLYNEVEGQDLYAERDVTRIPAGGEFPIITFQRRVPKVAPVEKWGGKFPITWEARDRNNMSEFTNAVRQLANTIVRKINQRGVEVLEAAITAGSRTTTGRNWSTVITGGSSQSNHTLWPANDFGKAAMLAEQDELGIRYTLWILNPQEYANLVSIYGDSLNGVLQGFGISLYVTNRVTAGTAYVVAEGQVGEMRVEQPLQSRSWDDADGIEQTWIQSSVRPVMFVNNKFAVLKFTGLAG